MSSETKPSFTVLPPEVLQLIVKAVTDNLKTSNPDLEYVTTLSSLSKTNRHLRDLSLPIIWRTVDISTVAELGQLRNMFRGSPLIAAHVKAVAFAWDMDGDYHCFEPYDEAEGTLLDIAFRDRLHMWESLRQKLGEEVQYEFHEHHSIAHVFFIDSETDKVYEAPGRCHMVEDSEDGSEVGTLPDYDAPRDGGRGPDGEGEDKHIKNANDLRESLTEVVSKMTSLEAFGFGSPVTPMPRGVFDALAQLTTLEILHLDLSTHRDNVHDLPFWELSHRLEALSLTFGRYSFHLQPYEEIEEQFESTFESIEIPASLPFADQAAKSAFHSAVACRTVAAAAKGGQLRRLNCDCFVQHPFAIRTLLKYWVHVNDWNGVHARPRSWLGAASALRPLLSHVSLWLGTTSSASPRKDRLLSAGDVQSLLHYFADGVPAINTHMEPEERQPVERYLPWLEDAELSQQVADAWNTVVERGDADELTCPCSMCSSILGGEASDDSGEKEEEGIESATSASGSED